MVTAVANAGKIPQAPAAKEPAERATNSFDIVASWLFSEPIADLLSLFGEEMPPATGALAAVDNDTSWLHLDEDLPDWLESLTVDGAAAARLHAGQRATLERALAVERVAARHFNFRVRADGTYRERAEISDGDLTDDVRARVRSIADQLGLVTPAPARHKAYDHTLVLGGGYRSPLLRARFTAELRGEGINLGEVSMLGSPRFLLVPDNDSVAPERSATEEFAPGARDEFDLMVGAARSALNVRPGPLTFLCGCLTSDSRCPQWSYEDEADASRTPAEFTHERCVDLFDGDDRVGSALSASTGRPPLRPDTADTFRLWARLTDPQPGLRALVVTTQVFVPFQTFDGLRRLYLPYGVDPEFIGLGPHWHDRPETAEYLLQETLSGIRSARRFLVAAAEVLRADDPRTGEDA